MCVCVCVLICLLKAKCTFQVEEARKELAWISEKKQIALDKLKKTFLDDVAVEHITLHALRSPYTVTSFRTKKLTQQQRESMDAVHALVAAEDQVPAPSCCSVQVSIALPNFCCSVQVSIALPNFCCSVQVSIALPNFCIMRKQRAACTLSRHTCSEGRLSLATPTARGQGMRMHKI